MTQPVAVCDSCCLACAYVDQRPTLRSFDCDKKLLTSFDFEDPLVPNTYTTTHCKITKTDLSHPAASQRSCLHRPMSPFPTDHPRIKKSRSRAQQTSSSPPRRRRRRRKLLSARQLPGGAAVRPLARPQLQHAAVVAHQGGAVAHADNGHAGVQDCLGRGEDEGGGGRRDCEGCWMMKDHPCRCQHPPPPSLT